MPKGPKGEKRPADVIGAAVKVAKIATSDLKPPLDPEEGAACRRDAAIKRMLETPPRQHKEDVGKGERREAERSSHLRKSGDKN